MNKGGGVLAEHRDVGHLFDRHDGRRKAPGQFFRVVEHAGAGIDIDHGHRVTSLLEAGPSIGRARSGAHSPKQVSVRTAETLT
jgi:hypothetical protein